MWLLIIWNVVCVTEELNFKFHLILINLILYSHMIQWVTYCTLQLYIISTSCNLLRLALGSQYGWFKEMLSIFQLSGDVFCIFGSFRPSFSIFMLARGVCLYICLIVFDYTQDITMKCICWSNLKSSMIFSTPAEDFHVFTMYLQSWTILIKVHFKLTWDFWCHQVTWNQTAVLEKVLNTQFILNPIAETFPSFLSPKWKWLTWIFSLESTR